jgi:hypothetical protein
MKDIKATKTHFWLERIQSFSSTTNWFFRTNWVAFLTNIHFIFLIELFFYSVINEGSE